MASGVKFFFFPFGVDGSLTVTPDPTQGGGAVSYQTGYTDNYELPLGSNVAALPLNRAQMNGLFNDITGAVQDVQVHGVPSWIGPSPNSPPDYSGNFPYPINALTYFTDGNIYQSLIANNTDTPGATANWLNISANAGASPIGSTIDFAGVVAPVNYLPLDGSLTTVSRTTYANLMAAITSTQTGVTSTSINITGLTSTAFMFIGMPVEGGGVQTGTTVASIVSGTAITLSLATTTSATESLTFFPWGNGNGTTTFSLPPGARQTYVGSGGTVIAGPGNQVGNSGGNESSNAVPTHTHAVASQNINGGASTGGGGLFPSLLSPNGGTAASAGAIDVVIATNGGASNILIFQPSTIMLKCIKYR